MYSSTIAIRCNRCGRGGDSKCSWGRYHLPLFTKGLLLTLISIGHVFVDVHECSLVSIWIQCRLWWTSDEKHYYEWLYIMSHLCATCNAHCVFGYFWFWHELNNSQRQISCHLQYYRCHCQAIVLASIAIVTFSLGMIPFKLVAKLKDNRDHQSQARF